MDANFVAQGPTTLLDLRAPGVAEHTTEDPRLVWHDDKVFLVYNGLRFLGAGEVGDAVEHREGRPLVRSLHLAELAFVPGAEGADVVVRRSAALRVPTDMHVRHLEKNWTPFSSDGALYFAYSVNPQVVFRLPPAAWDNAVATVAIPLEHVTHTTDPKNSRAVAATPPQAGWHAHEMRGGTGATYNPKTGRMESFFHSRTAVDTTCGLHVGLFVGFYAFAPTYPFTVTDVLPQPIAIPGLEETAHDGLFCAYPGGFVLRDNTYFVAYGRNDRSMGLVAIDAEVLHATTRQVTAP